jgi:peptidoglycan/LPS O-acetylase OafA/YrhL
MTDLSASIIAHPAARPQARPAAPPSLHFAGLLWSPIDFGLLLLLVLEFCPFMGRLSFSFFLFSWAVVSSWAI